MKLLVFFTASLLAGLVCSAPTSKEDNDTILITEEFFPDSLSVYTSQYDIVNILVPLNALNFEDDTDDDTNVENTEGSSDTDAVFFFVEADINDKGERVDKGLYMFKKGHVTKLLDNGRDSAAANDDTKLVFFAAKDGIYTYNGATNTTEKYGTVTESLKSIAKVNGSDIVYVLTDDNVLYKVTEDGTKKEKIDKVVNAKQIILDYENNLYYATTDNVVYVLVGDEVKKITGLPENPASLTIINPPFIMDNGVPVIIDNKSYLVYENGTSELGEFVFQVKPTAYSMEGTLIQYYAYNKKIYEYNILTLLFSELVKEIKTFLEGNSDDIQSIATRSRSDLRA